MHRRECDSNCNMDCTDTALNDCVTELSSDGEVSWDIDRWEWIYPKWYGCKEYVHNGKTCVADVRSS